MPQAPARRSLSPQTVSTSRLADEPIRTRRSISPNTATSWFMQQQKPVQSRRSMSPVMPESARLPSPVTVVPPPRSSPRSTPRSSRGSSDFNTAFSGKSIAAATSSYPLPVSLDELASADVDDWVGRTDVHVPRPPLFHPTLMSSSSSPPYPPLRVSPVPAALYPRALTPSTTNVAFPRALTPSTSTNVSFTRALTPTTSFTQSISPSLTRTAYPKSSSSSPQALLLQFAQVAERSRFLRSTILAEGIGRASAVVASGTTFSQRAASGSSAAASQPQQPTKRPPGQIMRRAAVTEASSAAAHARLVSNTIRGVIEHRV